MLFDGDARNLQIGIHVLRVDLQYLLELSLRLLFVTADEVVIAGVIQNGDGCSSLKKGLLINRLRLGALLFGIQLRSTPEGILRPGREDRRGDE